MSEEQKDYGHTDMARRQHQAIHIHIYYHVCMINEWEQIVREQMNVINESGLKNAAADIRIGCMGTQENEKKLVNIISDYFHSDKIWTWCNERIQDAEFHTLRIMHAYCQQEPDTYGFYFHSKGVSYPGHTGGKYWRDYMGYYNITRWKDCVQRLDDGNELCGVKLLTASKVPAHKLHYSGNFFWFRSEYIAGLPPVETLDTTNRYNAEIWHGINHPVACTMCQDFVDYNTKGNFIPPTL